MGINTSQRKIRKKMLRTKLLRLGVISLLVQSLCAGPASAEVMEENKWMLEITSNRNWVSGPGAAQSYLPTRHPFVGSDFSYRYQRTDSDKNFTFSFHGRSTDDQSVDKQTWSLTNLELGWSDKTSKFTAGDVMTDFSPYSMSGSLKGVSYNFRRGPGESGQIGQPEFTTVYGVSYPRWDNFWGGGNLKAIKRIVKGLNVREAVSEKVDLGLSLVSTDDSGRLASWDELSRNNVYAFNWEFRPEDGLTVKGESARSFTSRSPSDTDPTENYHGYAHQFSINQAVKKQKWTYEFERVSPKFTTLIGSALTDQERMKLRWTDRLTPDLSLSTGVSYTHDKVDDSSSKTFRTNMYQPELTFSFNAPFKRDNATLDLGMRLDRRYGGGTSTADRSITAAYRDTFGAWDADLSLDYLFYDTAPYDAGVRNKNLSFNITLARTVNRGEYILKPTLNVGLSRSMDILNHYNDRMFETSVGMGYQRPGDNLTANLKVGMNQNLKQVAPDSGKWFTSFRVDAQPKYLKMINQNAKQYLELNINAYRFDDTGNNYRETSLITGIRLEY